MGPRRSPGRQLPHPRGDLFKERVTQASESAYHWPGHLVCGQGCRPLPHPPCSRGDASGTTGRNPLLKKVPTIPTRLPSFLTPAQSGRTVDLSGPFRTSHRSEHNCRTHDAVSTRDPPRGTLLFLPATMSQGWFSKLNRIRSPSLNGMSTDRAELVEFLHRLRRASVDRRLFSIPQGVDPAGARAPHPVRRWRPRHHSLVPLALFPTS